MFKKVLVANRGEIAVRIVRTCRDLDIPVVALYDPSDLGSLHVRLANECVPLPSAAAYRDPQAILQIALETGADAIHPGYGFLAEHPGFVQACAAAAITFIGPPEDVVAALHNRVTVLETARTAGFKTTHYTTMIFTADNLDMLPAEAERLGYPLFIKPCYGGSGRGTQIVTGPNELATAVQHAQDEAEAVIGNTGFYLERAIVPARFIEVKVLGDQAGNLVHLGERQESYHWQNQRIIEESPAPCLSQRQREEVWHLALKLARLFNCRNACSVEFLVDADGQFYFTEIKPRIQIEHPVTEMVSNIDLVREQMRLAAGEPLGYSQDDIRLQGWALLCRISAADPWNNFLPSPGRLEQVHVPGGPHVRVDTYLSSGCEIPVQYDPTLATVVVWANDRDGCLRRMRRALDDFSIVGVATDLPLLQAVMHDPDFVQGSWVNPSASGAQPDLTGTTEQTERELRNIAVAAAIAYVRHTLTRQPATPTRTLSGWHRDSRRLPR